NIKNYYIFDNILLNLFENTKHIIYSNFIDYKQIYLLFNKFKLFLKHCLEINLYKRYNSHMLLTYDLFLNDLTCKKLIYNDNTFVIFFIYRYITNKNSNQSTVFEKYVC